MSLCTVCNYIKVYCLKTASHSPMKSYTYCIKQLMLTFFIWFSYSYSIKCDLCDGITDYTKIVIVQGHAECVIRYAETTPIIIVQRNYRRKYGTQHQGVQWRVIIRIEACQTKVWVGDQAVSIRPMMPSMMQQFVVYFFLSILYNERWDLKARKRLENIKASEV